LFSFFFQIENILLLLLKFFFHFVYIFRELNKQKEYFLKRSQIFRFVHLKSIFFPLVT